MTPNRLLGKSPEAKHRFLDVKSILGKIVLRPREYFGIVGFIVAPLDEPQPGVQDRIRASLKAIG